MSEGWKPYGSLRMYIAIAKSRLDSCMKATLLGMAAFADKDKYELRASQVKIASYAGLSVKSVQRCIARAEMLGLVKTQEIGVRQSPIHTIMVSELEKMAYDFPNP